MKDTVVQNWQYLTLLIAILGTWLSLLNIVKSDIRSVKSDGKADITGLRGEIRELKADLKSDINDLKGLVQHFIDLHIDHESRLSKVEEKTKKL